MEDEKKEEGGRGRRKKEAKDDKKSRGVDGSLFLCNIIIILVFHQL